MNNLRVGFIKKPHGLKGELKVLPLTDNLHRFKKLKKIFLSNNTNKEIDIEYTKVNKDELILKIIGVDTKEKAELLRGLDLLIPREQGVKLNQWEYYSQDIIGLEVFFENKKIGEVVDITNFGAGDLIEIQTDNNSIFYPFSKDYILSVEIDDKKIHISEYDGFFGTIK